jgi:hypothetical protein
MAKVSGTTPVMGLFWLSFNTFLNWIKRGTAACGADAGE